MGAEFGAFFDGDDRNFWVKLLEADRGGKARGAGANDHDIEIHAFAWRQPNSCLGHGGFFGPRAAGTSQKNVPRLVFVYVPKVLVDDLRSTACAPIG